MSGYLERLVSSAMQPTGSVHPVVAPLFSTSKHGIEEDDRTEQEIAPASAASSKLAHEESVEILRSYLPVTSKTDVGYEDPRVPQPTRSAAQVSAEESYRRQIVGRVGRADPQGLAANNMKYEPLLPEAPAVLAERRSDPRLESLPPVVPQSRSANIAQAEHLAAKKHEPDEIQITIGRIEVTAVAEVAHPAVKPARMQPSLDEYLKRADARER